MGVWTMTNGQEQETKASEGASRRESGLLGGGQGRIDEVGLSGVYPGSGDLLAYEDWSRIAPDHPPRHRGTPGG
jgi:hypothetical protein